MSSKALAYSTLVAIGVLVLGVVPAVASDADLRALNEVRVASHVPAVVEQQTGPLKAAAEALARQADDDGLGPADFSSESGSSLPGTVDADCRCTIDIGDEELRSFQWLYGRLAGSGLAAAWMYPPGSLAVQIRRRPASSIALAHPWLNETALARTRTGLIVVALAATRPGSAWRNPVIARPDPARHGSPPWVLLPAATRGRGALAVRKRYGYQHVMRLWPARAEIPDGPVRGIDGAWLARLADEEFHTPPSLAWGATYRVSTRTGRTEFKAPAMPARQRHATWHFKNLRPSERALFLNAVRHANKQARHMFSVIDGVTKVSVYRGRCYLSTAGSYSGGGYWVDICPAHLHDRSLRVGIVLHELGHVIDHSGLTTNDGDAFTRLFSRSRRWRRCFPFSETGCVQTQEVFADQFSYFASRASRVGGYGDPRLANRRQFGRLLAQRWLPHPRFDR